VARDSDAIIASRRPDHVRYPIPAGPFIEGGSDHHALLLDRSTCRLHEEAKAQAERKPSGLPRQAKVIARALKRYGLIVADNGSDWFMSGAPHAGWDQDQLRALARLRGIGFEAVDASGLRR
jgi:hypothetical protein